MCLGTCVWYTKYYKFLAMQPKVSVIIPVYKVELYIERCARSLFEQTLSEMEFIFVDDGTPDRSIDVLKLVLEDYPKRKEQTKILKNDTNRGLMQTRIRGQLSAKGEYLAAVDSDDWIESNAFEKLYKQAKETGADTVVFGYHREYKNRTEKCVRFFPYTNGKQFVRNVYKYAFEFFTWGSLVKNDDRFRKILHLYSEKPEWERITMWEDVAVMLPYYYGTNKIRFTKDCFYHYNKANENSAVNTQNIKKMREAYQVMDFLTEIFANDNEMSLTINMLKLGAKGVLLSEHTLNQWRHEHPEANKDILKYKSIPLKLRIFYYLIALGFDWPYHLYSRMKRFRG